MFIVFVVVFVFMFIGKFCVLINFGNLIFVNCDLVMGELFGVLIDFVCVFVECLLVDLEFVVFDVVGKLV